MVGFRTLRFALSDGELGNAAVWYPSARVRREEYSTKLGAWVMRAEKNVRPAQGIFPVILLSHDLAGHNLAYHDLCSALAEAGFVVIAPLHQGDCFENSRAIFSAAALYHRPRQMLDALAGVAKIQDLSSVINLERIGVIGCGSGSLTALQLAGVALSPQEHAGHCAHAFHDAAFCTPWAVSRLGKLPADYSEIIAKHGGRAFNPEIAGLKAVALMAPGGLFMLNKTELAQLGIPLAVIFAGQDELFRVPSTDEELHDMFPSPLFAMLNSHTVQGADHHSLNAPCPDAKLGYLPGMCGNLENTERLLAAKERNVYLISFFRAALGLPLSQEMQQ